MAPGGHFLSTGNRAHPSWAGCSPFQRDGFTGHRSSGLCSSFSFLSPLAVSHWPCRAGWDRGPERGWLHSPSPSPSPAGTDVQCELQARPTQPTGSCQQAALGPLPRQMAFPCTQPHPPKHLVSAAFSQLCLCASHVLLGFQRCVYVAGFLDVFMWQSLFDFTSSQGEKMKMTISASPA